MATYPAYPGMIASGLTDEGDFVPFELFAGESDIISSQGTADTTALEQFRVLARSASGTLVPWLGLGGAGGTDTLTFSTAVPANNDTVTINGTVITFVTGAAVGNQITIPATLALTGTALVNFLAANEGTFGVSGVSAGTGPTVVTLTALQGGAAGNTITVAKSSTNIAVGSATLAGGVVGSEAFAIAAQPIPAGTTGPIFTGGVFNHLALVWPASVTTLAARKAAFDGTNVQIGAILGVGTPITYA